jgi:DNA modification methylase
MLGNQSVGTRNKRSGSVRRRRVRIGEEFDQNADVVLYRGDARELLKTIPRGSVQLIVTSPPYNLGKEYEQRVVLEKYKEQQREIINMCIPLLRKSGSICWQVGNYISPSSEVVPLDIMLYDVFKSNGLVLRNRIVWHFGHGLHSSRRLSGRYETVLWFTQDNAEYYFDLDSVRVPQKYPGKRHFKGPNVGKYSGNPLGKSPSDVWDIPNVKANHVEKTTHPCQFPIGLVQRLVRSLSRKGDWVLDPFLGTGTTACAAIIEGRKAIGAEIKPKYQAIARRRIDAAWNGTLRYRPYDRPIYQPKAGSKLTRRDE